MSSTTTTGSKAIGGWVKRHPDVVLSLPEPGEEWAFVDLPNREDTPTPFPDEVLQYRSKLQGYSIIEKVGTREQANPHGSYMFTWETSARVYQYAKEKQAERGETFPCGHSAGFKTIDPDDGVYECGYEFCEERFDRETVERVMF